ncbi:hypothetical protein G9H61_04705 [Aquirufa ecclesiirivi]|uniref:Uncharacterized protein n=1 Tax=Aquirufa ecclesiirivi TaxID=2715124 RepID=A0ABT4JF40_9BACT|nr:hypothetical protein [Aquirufa ecclesiirivi]MCZ2474732.1 hypothetical protein [Aquirufa ecclesiirivi]
MINYLKNISFKLILAGVVVFICDSLESTILYKYLNENLISLLLTLLAINTATSGLIASKIQDILLEIPEIDFKSTIKEMKLSLLEQIVLIFFSISTLVLNYSKILYFEHKECILNIVSVAVLLYSIEILWDTGKSVFIIIEEIQNLKDSKK